MLVGGSRSGKTTVTIEEMICRAIRYPGSRHLCARLRFNHAKTSLWLDTIPKVLGMEGINRDQLRMVEADHFIQFQNGSELWVDGLDDKDRVEKVLGREYASIFFNEVSQIGYPSILLVLTRLAQNIPGCRNKVFYDLNPVGRLHWAYKLFIQKQAPDTGDPLPNPGDYASLYLNPHHNEANLPEGYIADVLDRLPAHKRRRFLLGEWGDPEGVIFTNWHVIDEIPEKVKRHAKHSCGLDFGFSVNPAAWVWLWLLGDELYLDEQIYETELTNQMLAKMMRAQRPKAITYADSAEPKSIEELRRMRVNIRGAYKGPDSVRAGIDWLLSKRIHISRSSVGLQEELQNYVWKENREGKTLPEPVDDYNHAIDAVRYGAEPWMRGAGVISGAKILQGR